MPKRQKQRSDFPMPPRVMDYGTDELWQRCHMIKERVDEHTVRAAQSG